MELTMRKRGDQYRFCHLCSQSSKGTMLNVVQFPKFMPTSLGSSKTFSGTPGNVSHHVLQVASNVWEEADSHLKAPHWPFLDLTGPEYIGAEN